MKKISILITITLIPWVMYFSLPSQKDQITIFNIGEGDSILIQSKEGNRILIDGGPDATVLSKLSKMIPWWDRNIDLLIVSHYHADHLSGLIKVLNNYTVGQIVLPKVDYPSPVEVEFGHLVELKGISVLEGSFLDEISAGEIHVIFAWPEENITSTELNDSAYANLITIDTIKILLSSDVELTKMTSEYLQNVIGDIDILKVPHQGSKSSLSLQVLDTIKPEVAVISVGKNNYGHPDTNILDQLNDYGVTTYRTDQDGDINIDIKDGKYTISISN